MTEKCNYTGCEEPAIAFLVWRPGASMVLDGGLSVAARCGAHPVSQYQQQLKRADPDAVFWAFVRGDGRPLTAGRGYTAA